MTELTDGKPENAMEFARKSQDAVVLFLNTIGNQGQSLNIEANDAFLTAFVVLLAVTKQTFGMSQDALTGVIMQSLLKVESLEANPNFARNQGVVMEIKEPFYILEFDKHRRKVGLVRVEKISEKSMTGKRIHFWGEDISEYGARLNPNDGFLKIQTYDDAKLMFDTIKTFIDEQDKSLTQFLTTLQDAPQSVR